LHSYFHPKALSKFHTHRNTASSDIWSNTSLCPREHSEELLAPHTRTNPATSGKDHRASEILIQGYRSSALIYRKLKLWHLTYLKENKL